MKFIDKSVNVNAGNAIVDGLLQACWNGNESVYQNGDYADLCRPQYKDGMLALMLAEQENLCCYCMRELISNHTTTLEHIIPHKIPSGEFANDPTYTLLQNEIVHRDNFDVNQCVIPPQKYPHDVAYLNLVASCNSNSHCNHYRGQNRIHAFFYDSDIEQKVSYDESGRVDCGEYENDFTTVGISTNKLLQLIRRIWKNLSRIPIPATGFTENDIEAELLLLTDDPDYTMIIDAFFDNPSKKQDLLKYKWFHQYYKQQTG